MCSILINSVVEQQLDELEASSDKDMIKKRLSQFAKDANTVTPGGLDTLDCRMKRMPDELDNVKKKRIGRHRIYYTGHHSQCSYTAIYIKMFKKSDVNREDDKKFQKTLIKALGSSSNQELDVD